MWVPMSLIIPGAPLKHLKRTLGITAECDAPDPRTFAVEPSEVTCPACQLAFANRQAAWHRELARTQKRFGGFGGKKKR